MVCEALPLYSNFCMCKTCSLNMLALRQNSPILSLPTLIKSLAGVHFRPLNLSIQSVAFKTKALHHSSPLSFSFKLQDNANNNSPAPLSLSDAIFSHISRQLLLEAPQKSLNKNSDPASVLQPPFRTPCFRYIFHFLLLACLPAMTPGTCGNSNHNAGSFDAFFEGWLVRQEHYLDELLSVQESCHETQEDDLKDLITRLLSHYQQYFEERSRVARRNIFLVFSPTWLSSFERATHWIAGFKPGIALKLLCNSAQDLSPEQGKRIKRLMEETRYEERVLNEELAKVQESMAAPPLLGIVKKRARLMNVEIAEEEAALVTLRKALEEVVAGADLLRMTTALKVVEILSPVQNVRFLAAATQLLVKLRSWGLQKDGERGTLNING